MKTLTIVALILFSALTAHAQQTAQQEAPIRKGFTLGGSAGVGVLHFTDGATDNQTSGNISLPNMKIGWFLTPRTALYLNTTSQIYETNGRDRSFEGYIPTIQYYTGSKWWVSGGFGPSLDTRAFYESKSKSAATHWGKGVLLSTGYEFKQRAKWALDLQARLYMASINIGEGQHLEGTSFTIAVGITLL